MSEEQDKDKLLEIVRRQHDVLVKMKSDRAEMESELKKLKDENMELLIEKEEMKGDTHWRDESLSLRDELNVVASELDKYQKQNLVLRRENDSLRSGGEEAATLKTTNEGLKKKISEYESRILALVKVVEQCKNKVNLSSEQCMRLKVDIDEERLKRETFMTKVKEACDKNKIAVEPESIALKMNEMKMEVQRANILVEEYKSRYNRAVERMADMENQKITNQSSGEHFEMIEDDAENVIE
ncbi:hypothetical protein EIN_097180 [Entamoeba invadens IP1]|uniref:Uncharacterized protein n=1 Tax=Entamoeba invadens IP1 TaxID=370355 RepID=A0A0A1U6L2_ENTIV|nr:hypothetical protein EIN_097180 [Entamoeba invadens IP1]ELP87451.1 hypothetical protein EIN_097180 [Entamoeba invadens IP1]|eukprot:XP_004254222.1 hypothetical protein EIN_097180 [Entamoeba invadens IP1]